MDIQSNELSGGSGAKIIYYPQYGIIKKSVSMHDISAFKQLNEQYLWMKYHSQRFPQYFPQILNCGFRNDKFFYKMEYIQKDSNHKLTRDQLSGMIFGIRNSGFAIKSNSFKTYISRLYSHIAFLKEINIFKSMLSLKKINVTINEKKYSVDNISFYDYFKKLQDYTQLYTYSSNCHGDFTLGNIINGKCIDSNYHFDQWNSSVLDISKLWQSIHFDYEQIFSDDCSEIITKDYSNKIGEIQLQLNYKKEIKLDLNDLIFDSYPETIMIFELSHYIRMLKYKLQISQSQFIKAYCIMCLIWDKIKRNEI